jgi:hypothetical protein
MKIANLLRRVARRMAFWGKADCRSTGGNSIYGDIEDQLRIMSDEEFAEYLQLHTKRSKV